MRRVRLDEDGALSQCFAFSMLLIRNQVQMKTTAGCASNLNLIIERPNNENHINIIIGLGLQPNFPEEHWCFSRKRVAFIKCRTWNVSTNSTPH